MKLLILGIQGAGKSTQGNLLAAALGLPYLSSGHIFRQMSKEKSPWGRYVKETINSGVLIPDDKALSIIEEYLAKDEYKDGYILDGFPRTIAQAEAFKNGISHAIYLKVNDKEALWRISGRVSDREDETLQAIRKRIASFHEFTEPVIGYYKNVGTLLEIDGERDVQEIFNDIMERIKK
jgi:adenylate kinase